MKQDHDQEHLAQGKLAFTPTFPRLFDQVMALTIFIKLGEIIKTAIQSRDIKTHGDDLCAGFVKPQIQR